MSLVYRPPKHDIQGQTSKEYQKNKQNLRFVKGLRNHEAEGAEVRDGTVSHVLQHVGAQGSDENKPKTPMIKVEIRGEQQNDQG